MMQDDKLNERERRFIGAVISRVLKKTGIGAKIGGGIVGVAVVATGVYFGIPLVIEDDPAPAPTPIIEPLNETSTPAIIGEPGEVPRVETTAGHSLTPVSLANETSTPAIIEGSEESFKQNTNGQSQPPTPSSNETTTEAVKPVNNRTDSSNDP